MHFVSLEFLIFLPIVFFLYWALRRWVRWQNLFVVAASYVFYGWWDWRYMFLLGGYTLCSFCSGLLLGKFRTSASIKRIILWSAVAINVGVLCVYKYLDFFTLSTVKLAACFGITLDWVSLNLVLPVGISFFTFQALGYTIDVYRNNIAPTRDIISFFAFMSFFPQMVAGPIEKADRLLPQFQCKREFSYREGVEGMKRILWGLFKKMVVADNCAIFVNQTFVRFEELDAFSLLLGAVFFTFQIYGDFSGYCDIAVGCGRLLGIRLSENFRLPYFSKNIKEFWRRWHITLQLWFRDYVYLPFGGNRKGLGRLMFNILIVFALSGLWHGARYTYILWGLYNGVLIAILILIDKYFRREGIRVWYKGAAVFVTFCFIVIGWIIFRSYSVYGNAIYLYKLAIFAPGERVDMIRFWPCLVAVMIMMTFEFLNRKRSFGLDFPAKGLLRYRSVRWSFYWVLTMLTFVMAGTEQAFIYFQF